MSGLRLVNKQFNSPINLYSPEAIRETLEKQTQVLTNGAVGIDFNQLSKPKNLQNSAVLKMLEEEEERKRRGEMAGLKKVTWPPEQENYDELIEQGPVETKTRGAGEYAVYQSSQSPTNASSNVNPGVACNINEATSINRQRPQPQLQQQLKKPVATAKTWSPVTPPSCVRSLGPPAKTAINSQIAPPPSSSPINDRPKSRERIIPITLEQYPSRPQQKPTVDFTFSNNSLPAQNHQQSFFHSPLQDPLNSPYYPTLQRPSAPQFEPPPSIITLRNQVPISQEPFPIYFSQPAATQAAELAENDMRGDQKWPPQYVREKVEAENQARVDLAKGPVCRPRRPNKDYTSFFAQNALTNNYPGYRTPPGTQFYTPAYHQ